MFLCDNIDMGCLCVYVLSYCYEMFYVLCHKRPRVLQVIKVTSLICATLTIHLGAKFLNQN